MYYVCVCVYRCIHLIHDIHGDVCTYKYIYIHIYINIHAHTLTRLYKYIDVEKNTHTHTYTPTQTHTHVSIPVRKSVHTRTNSDAGKYIHERMISDCLGLTGCSMAGSMKCCGAEEQSCAQYFQCARVPTTTSPSVTFALAHTPGRASWGETQALQMFILCPTRLSSNLVPSSFCPERCQGRGRGRGGLIITLYVQGHKKCARGSKNIIFLPGKVQCIQAEWPCLLISFSERMGHTVLPSFTSISRPK